MPNRTLCDVLEEMRKCYKTRNFAYLNGLIEEAQTMGDQKEIERLREQRKELKAEIAKLKEKKALKKN